MTTPAPGGGCLPVCIAGMHRSGTSVMARLLNLSGLYLGRAEDMLAVGPDNPEGHWEHEGLMQVNERLLAEFGGGWDLPPDLSALGDERRTAHLADTARTHLARFAGHEPWGWKDPRNTLTLPFWRRLLGPVHVVVCVRHPLEVALSLRARNGSTVAFGLALWTAYTEALLAATRPEERIVTHFQRSHADPVAEAGRVAARLDVPCSGVDADRLRRFVRPELRHARLTFADLLEVRVSTRICRLYRQLCLEADAPDQSLVAGEMWTPTAEHGAPDPIDVPGRFDHAALEQARRRP